MAEQQKFTVELPSWVSEEDLEAAGEDIIQFIVDRSRSGQGIRPNGRRYDFPEYSESYRAFKGSSKVDLTLSSEMLSEIKLLAVKGRTLEIGFDAGSRVNAKAEGNQLGSYGGAPNPKKARRFLGINREELAAVLARFKE